MSTEPRVGFVLKYPLFGRYYVVYGILESHKSTMTEVCAKAYGAAPGVRDIDVSLPQIEIKCPIFYTLNENEELIQGKLSMPSIILDALNVAARCSPPPEVDERLNTFVKSVEAAQTF